MWNFQYLYNENVSLTVATRILRITLHGARCEMVTYMQIFDIRIYFGKGMEVKESNY